MQESSQGFKSGRATATKLAKGMLSSALAATNVSMLEEGKDKNDARMLNSGSRSALEDEQSYKNLSKEMTNSKRIKEYPPFIYSEHASSIGKKLNKNPKNAPNNP